MKISGEGEAGVKGAPRGDLYVNVAVKEHAFFERRENDLFCEVLIPFTVAALGGDVQVPTLDGKTDLKVPAGTPSGEVFKIKGEGLPVLGRGETRGEQYVRIEIEVPKKLEASERKLLQELAKSRGDKVQMKKKGLFGHFKDAL